MDPDTYLSQFIALFNHIEVYPPDLGATIALVLSVLLLGCSGFVSASEIAFFSLSPTDVGKIEENRHAADGKILELKKDSERLLATILISNNFVNVAIIMLLNFFFSKMIDVKEKITLEYKRLCQKNTFQRTIATVTQSMAMAMA